MKNLLNKISGIRQLLSSIDLDQIAKLSQKVDLPKMVGLVSQMSESDLSKMMGMLKGGGKPKEIPPINGDFYELGKSLPKHEREIQLRVREFMEREIKPIANEYWNRAEFPMHIIPKMAELDIAGLTYQGYGCPGHSALLEGFIAMERRESTLLFLLFLESKVA